MTTLICLGLLIWLALAIVFEHLDRVRRQRRIDDWYWPNQGE